MKIIAAHKFGYDHSQKILMRNGVVWHCVYKMNVFLGEILWHEIGWSVFNVAVKFNNYVQFVSC